MSHKVRVRRMLPGNVWARMLQLSLLCATVVAVLLIISAGLVQGRAAVISVLVGAAVVSSVFAVSLAALWWASHRIPGLIALVMVALYAVLVFIGAAVLLILPAPRGLLPGWVGVAAVAQLCAWLAASARVVAHARLPIFDVPLTPQLSQKTKDQVS
ncbi:MAG: hypothetical protein Q4C81_03670 [Kocuria sp.]|nr:hypothetical protein [Kocuria sp.]